MSYKDSHGDNVYFIGGRYWKVVAAKEVYRHDGMIEITDWQGVSVEVSEDNPEVNALIKERAKLFREVSQQKREDNLWYWEQHFNQGGDKPKGKGKKE